MGGKHEIKIYPESIGYHDGKPELRNCREVVKEGKVLRWDPWLLSEALISVQDNRNNQEVDRGRLWDYCESINQAAVALNASRMKEVISDYRDLVPQVEEVLELPDDFFVGAAVYMTQAIG
jgi:hypothetical protein